MFSWSLLYGGLAYIILGMIMSKVTFNYLRELTDNVMKAFGDTRYADMLWYTVKLKDTKQNRFLVDVAFTTFWPIICIASILKAEENYDRIMRRSAFGRRVP